MDEQIAVSFNRNEGVKKELEQSHTLSSSDWRGLNRNQDQTAVYNPYNLKIRKLTPVECERLQGYPDNHTAFGRKVDGTIYNMSNTQRYKQIGNGISSPVSKAVIEHLIPEGEVNVMSLFSGVAGTELKLDKRFKVVGHCEFDKYASDVLRYHYPNIPNFGDVTEFVIRKDIPDFELLVGGFPCQAWSLAGLRKGFDDEQRGQLIYNVFDIMRKHNPKYVVLENVKGLLSHNKGESFVAIMEYISSLGYEVGFELVNSKHFGLAQNRERVFIVATRR
jgi:site-specific DNA-cytosine methylase